MNHNGNHRGQTMIINHVVENGWQPVRPASAVLGHYKWSPSAGDVLLRHVNPHLPFVGAIETGINFAVGRVHGELIDASLGNALDRRELGRVGIIRAEREISVTDGSNGSCSLEM